MIPVSDKRATWLIVLVMIGLTAVALYAGGAGDLLEAIPWK